MDRNRFARRLGAGSALLFLVGAFAMPTIALADNEPNGAASCMSIEHAAISPPGSSEEEPGGSRQFVSEVKDLAADQGVTAGSLFSWIASLHSGSHEECDAALGGGDSSAAVRAASSKTTDQLRRAQSTPRSWPKVL